MRHKLFAVVIAALLIIDVRQTTLPQYAYKPIVFVTVNGLVDATRGLPAKVTLYVNGRYVVDATAPFEYNDKTATSITFPWAVESGDLGTTKIIKVESTFVDGSVTSSERPLLVW